MVVLAGMWRSDDTAALQIKGKEEEWENERMASGAHKLGAGVFWSFLVVYIKRREY